MIPTANSISPAYFQIATREFNEVNQNFVTTVIDLQKKRV